jgi:hypothetical protein
MGQGIFGEWRFREEKDRNAEFTEGRTQREEHRGHREKKVEERVGVVFHWGDGNVLALVRG